MSSSSSFFLENLGELECRRGEKNIFSLISCLLRGRLYFRWHKEEVFFQEIPFCAGESEVGTFIPIRTLAFPETLFDFFCPWRWQVHSNILPIPKPSDP